MIKPSIGRVMWYWPEKAQRGDQPWVALVTYVWDDNLVNLVVFDRNGDYLTRLSVPIVQEGSPAAGDSPYAEWMPYQKGQAAKAEALEAKIAAA